jgi:hypothetical protein
LQIHRKILYDLVVHYLEPISSAYGRLAYVASLKDANTGKYVHEKLAAVYGEERVTETLAKCHQELFERLLEMPLAQQEEDLRSYAGSLHGETAWNESQCVAATREWIPSESPDYLKELFCSNTRALCELLQNKSPNR